MRAPTPSEPKYTFPTYQVPQVSAMMRGGAPPVQVDRAACGARADSASDPRAPTGATSVILPGSGRCCRRRPPPPANSGTPSVKPTTTMTTLLQPVTDDNCLLNSVTVPKIQRNDGPSQQRSTAAHNNSDKLDGKFGALQTLLGRDNIPTATATTTTTTTTDKSDDDDLEPPPPPPPDATTGSGKDNVSDDDEDTLTNTHTTTATTTTAMSSRNNRHTSSDTDGSSKETCQNNDCSYAFGLQATTTTTTTTPLEERCAVMARDLARATHCSTPLRLRGGGESSLSTGTTGWGTPPSQQASNNNTNNSSGWGTANPANQNNAGTQQWNNNPNRQPNANQGPGPQQDNNKTNAGMNANGQQPPASQTAGQVGQVGGTGSWGGQPNNKPQPNVVSQPPVAVNNPVANQPNGNGQPPNTTTSSKQQLEQLNSMREAIFSPDGWGVQVNQDTNWDVPGSPEPSLKLDGSGGPPPWKPTVNNGTELWEANLRNGGQPPPQPQQKTPWGHTPSTNIGGTWGEDDDTDSTNVWTGAPSGQQQWGNNTGNSGGGTYWGPKKDNDWGTSGSAGWGDPRSADPRTAGMDPRDMRPDLRNIRAGNTDPMRLLDPRDPMRIAGGDMRGDPRGITGRLNGAAADGFWGQAGPHTATQHMPHPNKMPVGPGNNAGWEEPSPPSTRRSMPNYDDGTSFWGNPQQAGSHWKDLPTGANMGRGNTAGPPGMAPSRSKPELSVWGQSGGRNGSWDEPPPMWDDPSPWPKHNKIGGGTPLWENELDWGHKQGPKQPLTKEMIWNSKQFRVLIDMGHKKEDAENALRVRDMNLEEALELLSPLRTQDWNRHDDHYDHPQFQQRFQPGPAGQMSFPPGGNPPNLLNNMNSSSGGNNSLINNISPAVVQKMLTQSGNTQGFGVSTAAASRSMQPQSQPSTQQLKMLVQQIQMAVQAGYLNHQILNQPLAPQTLVLLNQLLQQIKALQQLVSQQTLAQSQCINGKPNSNNFLQCSVLITKTKQQITNLQNQIAAQQAIYVKQQHQVNLGGGPSDLFKSNSMHDSISALQSNFVDLGMKDPQVQQSRLNQWINKDKEEGSEFSRAPGSTAKPLTASPNIPLSLSQPDGPWSSGRTGDGWPETNGGESNNDSKDAQWPTPAQPSLTDLVPEFEPGKPWKGNQIKSIEDDPSITPGSVVRSPLSIANIKDSELFNMNTNKSPPLGDSVQPLSLSSSTWSFNPPASTSSAFTSPQVKLPTTKGGLGDLNPTTAVSSSELWGAPKSRGPPPGLSTKTGSLMNGWSCNLGSSAAWGGSAGQRVSGNWGGASPWLLLRNLTAQIDGSTLRTLCMQHGPLLSFHLYLHQGFALAKYATREEATKAQSTLNNCVLGNTSILAENPSDWDASALLQQVASQPGSSGAWRGSTKQPLAGADTWSTGWSNNPTSASLWGSTPLDTSDPARATPSSLNSFLPGDLLGDI